MHNINQICYIGCMDNSIKKLLIIAAGVLVFSVVIGFFGTQYFGKYLVKSSKNVHVVAVLPSITVSVSPEIIVSPSVAPSSTVKVEEAITEPEKVEEKPAPAPKKVLQDIDPPSYGGAFQWGVTMRPNVFGKYSGENWESQIKTAKDLGVGWARVNWDYDNSDPAARNTAVINDLSAKGIKTLLVIEHNPAKGNSNLYQQGLTDAKTITSTLKSKVDFYQLANEGGAESLIGGKSGVSASDYDDGRYNNVKDYIKGLSDGIASGDPGSTRIVTISWVHSGFLDRLVGDGVNFDMIGIDWYSWMGPFNAKKIDGSETLFHKLQTFRKPLSFMEVSTMPDAEDSSGKRKTIVDEDKQANFLGSTANWAWTNRSWVKGFYHFELVDNTLSGEFVDYYGLVRVKKVGNELVQDGTRKAFGVFRDIISGK